ncbi:hypothetical protein HJFPF1_05106 [Paramyrothecium foliicola]|nr:hypothetical protein HJFPF1_05106 [Paramyrothecium foliicola]
MANQSKMSFMVLPPEVRVDIYRNVLVDDGERGVETFPKLLFPAILRTCRRMRYEALPIFYGENAWLIELGARHAEGQTEFTDKNYIDERLGYFFLSGKLFFRRFRVSIDRRLCYSQWMPRLVREVCVALSEIPRLARLVVEFSHTNGVNKTRASRVLEFFGLLRNVGRVEFKNVPVVYINTLTPKMTGSTPIGPQDRFAKMCTMLEAYARPVPSALQLVRRAEYAMTTRDEETFLRLRSKIVDRVENAMAERRRRMFLYDSDAPEDDTAPYGPYWW